MVEVAQDDRKLEASVLSSGHSILLYRGGLECYASGIVKELGINALRRWLADDDAAYGDPTVPLSEALASSFEQDQQATIAKATACLQATRLVDPDEIKKVLTGPFHRIYDISCGNVLDLTLEAAPSSKKVELVYGLDAPSDRYLQVVKLGAIPDSVSTCGVLAPPAEDYDIGRRTWHRRLTAEALTFNAIVLAESLSDPDLWRYLASLRRPSKSRRQTLVMCPNSQPGEVARLQALGFVHLDQEPSEFVARLVSSRHDVSEGNKVLARARSAAGERRGIVLLNARIAGAPPGSTNFLRGFEPTFGDIRDGISARLSTTARIRDSIGPLVPNKKEIVVVSGPAGAGKSTAVMSIALELVKDGIIVGWIDRQVQSSVDQIVTQLEELAIDVLVVDDVDVFGDSILRIAGAVKGTHGSLLLGTARSTRMNYLAEVLPTFKQVKLDDRLSQEDLLALVSTLRAHSLLGILQSHRPFPEAAADELGRISSGDLLAAMVQVVTGEKFDDRIRSEVEQLSGLERLVYQTACIFQSLRENVGLKEASLIEICTEFGAAISVAQCIESLISESNLLTRRFYDEVAPRHHAIAERVLVLLKQEPSRLSTVHRSLLRHFASLVHSDMDPANPDRRVMVRLLNHSLLRDYGLPESMVNETYDSVRQYLDDDFHYWLQRASFEVEHGRLESASGFIENAIRCEGGEQHFQTITEWSRIKLLRAQERPADLARRNDAREAIRRLIETAKSRGARSPHSFTVLARDGSNWLVKTTELPEPERKALAAAILDVIKIGRSVLQHNEQFGSHADEGSRQLNRMLRSFDKGFPV